MAGVGINTMDTDMTYSRDLEIASWTDPYVNLSQMCRICALHNDYLIPIFDGEGLQHRLDLKIRLYLPIDVSRDDVLPVHICYNCASTLMSWNAFYSSCKDGEYKFRSMLGIKASTQVAQPELDLSSTQPPPPPHPQASLNLSGVLSSQHGNHPPDPSLGIGVPVALMPDGSVHEYTIPHGVLDNMMSADLAAGITTDIVTLGSEVTSHSVQTQVLISNAETQTECFLSPNPSEKKIPTCALVLAKTKQGKPSTKIKIVVVKKRRKRKGIDEVDIPNTDLKNGLEFLRENEKLLHRASSSRESAIQSTNSSLQWDQSASSTTSRLKTVLVRHEGVPIEKPVPSVSSVETVNQQANQNISSAVSVVRPTCLRRAPTKVPNSEKANTHEYLPKSSSAVSENYNQAGYEGVIVASPSGDIPSPNSQAEGEDREMDPSRMCFHCGTVINNLTLLHAHERSHLSTQFPPTSFECKFCFKHFDSFNEMQSHQSEHEADADKKRKSLASRKAHLCRQCGQMCTTEERLVLHQRLHTDNLAVRAYECKTCGETFQTRSKLSVHLWNHAVKPSLKTFKCHICGKGFMTKYAVLEHRLKHTEEERSRAYKCIICGMAFGNNTLLGKHRATHSAEERARPFKCSFCGKAFARNHTLQIHHLTHSEEKSHLCSQCGKGFKMRNSLLQHMRTHQDPSAWPTFPCNLCRKTFRVKSRLRDHLRLHTGDMPYECKTCGKRFHKVTSLHTHEVSHTERRPYMCDVCGKAFKWSKNLRQHKTVHDNAEGSSRNDVQKQSLVRSKSQPCQCEVCGKQLAGKSSLRQHIANIHNGGQVTRRKSQPTNCPVCNKVLCSSGGLLRHIKITHGGVKAFKCDICDRDYSTRVARDDHRRSHTGERPFACSVCPKTFTSLSNLHVHRTIHSEDRPHKCSYCEKQFKRRAHLILHTRTHTGEKPYVCNICNRGFAQSNDLHKHRLTHSNDKAYACHCGMAYRLKRDLVRHQFKHHPPLILPPEPHPLPPAQPVVEIPDSSALHTSTIQTIYNPTVLVRNLENIVTLSN